MLREQEEHEALIRHREDPDAAVTWAEYKSMTFTTQVSLAWIRAHPTLNFLLREHPSSIGQCNCASCFVKIILVQMLATATFITYSHPAGNDNGAERASGQLQVRGAQRRQAATLQLQSLCSLFV